MHCFSVKAFAVLSRRCIGSSAPTQSAVLWVICFHCCSKPNFWNHSWSLFGVFDGNSSFSFAAFSHYLHPFVQLSFAIWSQVEGTSSLERHFRTSSWLNLFCFPLSSPLMLLYKLKKKHASALAFQAEVIMNYHVGETVLSLQKTTLIPGGSESLVYTTLSGGIGILVPFTSHEVSKPRHQAAVLLLFVHLSLASILMCCIPWRAPQCLKTRAAGEPMAPMQKRRGVCWLLHWFCKKLRAFLVALLFWICLCFRGALGGSVSEEGGVLWHVLCSL